jgi:hypothetical protein
MFPRLQARLDGLEAHAHGTLTGADNLILLAKDLLLDLKDGFGITLRPVEGFPQFMVRLVVSVASYLTALTVYKIREFLPFTGRVPAEPQLDLAWMVGVPIPLRVEIDPAVDISPHRVSQFVGGPPEYDGKRFVVDVHQTEMTLKGGHCYVWDGKVFRYRE